MKEQKRIKNCGVQRPNACMILEKGFMQCSLVKGCESKCNYRLRIFVPKGSQVIYLGNVNNEQYYYEVDIQTGAKLEIVSVDDRYINCKLLGTNNDF